MSNTDDLRGFITRIEDIEDDILALTENRKAVYAEASAAGFVPKIIRKIVRERAMDAAKRVEEWRMLAEYRAALGMLAGTPLGDAAVTHTFKDGTAATGE